MPQKTTCFVAYLLLAHDQPHQLARLINRLNTPDAVFFIHVDSKSDIHPFRTAITPRDNVIFLESRVNVFWGGFSVVEAMLQLMRHACSYDFRYAVLLSGSDYPIKTNDHIYDFLDASSLEYINFWKLADRTEWLYRIQYYHYLDSYISNPRLGPAVTRLASKAYHKILESNALSLVLPRRTYPFEIVPYGGSQWWMLTRSCIQYLLCFVDDHKRLMDYYRFTYVPDEMFVQTVILNSPHSERVVNQEAYMRWSENHRNEGQQAVDEMLDECSFHYRYMYWSRSKGLPATLDEQDFNTLSSSEALFARKFRSEKSQELLRMIDTQLLSRPAAYTHQGDHPLA